MYIPPPTNIELYEDFFLELTASDDGNGADRLVVIGDFNLPTYINYFKNNNNVDSGHF